MVFACEVCYGAATSHAEFLLRATDRAVIFYAKQNIHLTCLQEQDGTGACRYEALHEFYR